MENTIKPKAKNRRNKTQTIKNLNIFIELYKKANPKTKSIINSVIPYFANPIHEEHKYLINVGERIKILMRFYRDENGKEGLTAEKFSDIMTNKYNFPLPVETLKSYLYRNKTPSEEFINICADFFGVPNFFIRNDFFNLETLNVSKSFVQLDNNEQDGFIQLLHMLIDNENFK